MKPLSNPPTLYKDFWLVCILIMLRSITFCQPVANFSADITSGCTPVLVNFTDVSTGTPSQWKWDLGNGTISYVQNPSVTYFQSGQYTVKLIISAANGTDSIARTNYISVNNGPVVNFSADITSGCNPFIVNFTDNSSGDGNNISSWQWDFGDGVLSNQQQPSHTYTMGGTYSVSLKVTNSVGCISSIRKTELIKDYAVTAAFSQKTISTCLSNQFVFQNTSSGTGNITSHWDFGDGSSSDSSNPTHRYVAGGNYSVKLFVNNQNGCSDSLVSNLKVLDPVSAVFSADKLLSCKAPQAVQFTSQNRAGNTYLWNFNDSTTAAISSPLHVFKDTGNFTIKLTIKNADGCTDSFQVSNYIQIQKPFVTLQNLPDSGCLPMTKSLSARIAGSDSVTNYNWSFGDGSTSTAATPTHSFNNLGYYDISLVATGANGCSDTAILKNAIRITKKPIADFSADMLNGCAYSAVNFTNLSSADANSFVWDFGDFGSSEDKNPKHTYKDTGWQSIQLIALSGGCADTALKSNYIYLKPSVARFDIFLSCANPYLVTFVNSSIGATRWKWTFGDGSTSASLQPTHTYAKQGLYNVSLETWNDSTGCYYLSTKQVNILDVKLNFAASDSIICRGDSVWFNSTNSNTDIAKYSWDFGDGIILNGSSNHVLHYYKKPGNYTVKLTTLNVLNCFDTLVKPQYIKVKGPSAKFGTSNLHTCANSSINFSDSSIADPSYPLKKWIWNYGDGKIDSLTKGPFQHSYTIAGTFPVMLKLIDTKGCSDSFQLSPSININKVIAKFMITDTVACPNSPVRFVCPYALAGVKYFWNFGDGSTANTQMPTHNYAKEGNYTIKLTVQDAIGCTDSSTVAFGVKVTQTIASFNMSDSFRTCPPLVINFSDHSSNAINEYWDFGDSSYTKTSNPSHFYTYPGTYTATLYAYGPGGCVRTAQHNIVVKGPVGTIKYQPLKLCKPYQVNFQVHSTDAVSYIWDFNDGNTAINSDTVIKHVYQDSGKFLPKIILIDEIGCRVPVSGKDSITNLFATPAFTLSDSILCDKGSVNFTNTTFSNDAIATWRWDMGDGSISNQKSPVHQYSTPGIYYPALSVTTQFGCFASTNSVTPVKVVISPKLSMVTGSNGCIPLNMSFVAVPQSPDSVSFKWNWDFNNGNYSTSQIPGSQVYSTPGQFTVRLTATSRTSGCATSINHTIESYPLPDLLTSPDSYVCKGKSLMLNASGAANYQWTPGFAVSCDTCASITASPVDDINFSVKGTSVHGCISNKTVAVSVKKPFAITYSAANHLCKGQLMKLQASGADTYQWSPATGLDNASIANPVAQPDSSTNYQVIGTDDKGCFKDTGIVPLTVYPMPTVNAGPDKTITVGSTIDLVANISDDVTEVNWSPTGDIFRNTPNTATITVKPVMNTEYTVDVKNIGGCAARDQVTVFVTCNGTNVFIPNLFSPNGDGVNDVFYPRGNGLLKIVGLKIFNRWGQEVFEKKSFNANDPSSGWDGMYKGAKLNADVYVYTIELICDNESILTFNGNVALVR